MKLEMLKQKLQEMLGLSDSEVTESQENLAAIIDKLKQRKRQIKDKMQLAAESDETSVAFHDLEKEYKVVTKLIKKAKKNFHQGDADKIAEITQDS